MKEKRPLGPAGHRQRLRERFLRAGLPGLSDVETIELLLTFAIPRHDVKPLARELIDRFGSVGGVLDAPPAELLDINGIGQAAATMLVLLKQLCGKYLEQETRAVDLLDSGDKVIRYLRMKLGGGRKECFMVLYLNSQNHLLTTGIVQGTVDRAAVYAREVAEKCLLCRATGVIVAHNHPSGVCDPSPEDINLTRRLKTALASLNIALHDHIIVTASAHLSFRAAGLL